MEISKGGDKVEFGGENVNVVASEKAMCEKAGEDMMRNNITTMYPNILKVGLADSGERFRQVA